MPPRSARRLSSLALALVLLLAAPTAAPAAKQGYSGIVSFDAIGKRNEKGRLIAKSVRNFTIGGPININCFDPSGRPVTSTTSAWLFPQPGPMRVGKGGSFAGQFTAGDSTTTISGRLSGGKASGTVEGKSGPTGGSFCTTGQPSWAAKRK